jgi:hypothetical protein
MGWLSLRLAAIPGELRAHDFAIKVLNEEIELWVADSYRDLEQELRGISSRLGAPYRGWLSPQRKSRSQDAGTA